MRLDGHIDTISLSISFPNYKMFYKYRMTTSTRGWVVIALSPSILWEYECAFCKYNAADSRISKLPKDYLNSIKSLKEMFAENNEDKGVRTANRLKEFDPTDPQAEVLVFSNIPIEKIISINFYDKKLQSEFSEKHPNILSTYNKEHFDTRDYVRK